MPPGSELSEEPWLCNGNFCHTILAWTPYQQGPTAYQTYILNSVQAVMIWSKCSTRVITINIGSSWITTSSPHLPLASHVCVCWNPIPLLYILITSHRVRRHGDHFSPMQKLWPLGEKWRVEERRRELRNDFFRSLKTGKLCKVECCMATSCSTKTTTADLGTNIGSIVSIEILSLLNAEIQIFIKTG